MPISNLPLLSHNRTKLHVLKLYNNVCFVYKEINPIFYCPLNLQSTATQFSFLPIIPENSNIQELLWCALLENKDEKTNEDVTFPLQFCHYNYV
jgi:hypothetical protein